MDAVLAGTIASLLLSGCASLALAGVVFSARGTSINRALGAYLVLGGLSGTLYGACFAGFVPDVTLSYNLALLADATQLAAPIAYFIFIGLALDTPLTRTLGKPVVRWGLAAMGVALFAWPFTTPLSFFGAPYRAYVGTWFVTGPADTAANWITIIVAIFGLISSFTALLLVHEPRKRKQIVAYTWAFGLIDSGLALTDAAYNGLVLGSATQMLGYVSTTAGVALLARALVRQQLFDFDLKVKWTLRRGTVAAVFIAVFFVVAQVAQSYLTGAFGWLAGGVAAGALLFALRPLERAADRLADKAMPDVAPTPSYLQFKKLDVYRAAVESALEEGGISAKERAILDRLRAKLALHAEDTVAIEREAEERLTLAA